MGINQVVTGWTRRNFLKSASSPRSCSENIRNMSQTQRNYSKLTENEAIKANGCGLIFLPGKRKIWNGQQCVRKVGIVGVWSGFQGLEQQCPLEHHSQSKRRIKLRKMSRECPETQTGPRNFVWEVWIQMNEQTWGWSESFWKGMSKLSQFKWLLKNTPLHVKDHKDNHTSQTQQVACVLWLRVVHGPGRSWMAFIKASLSQLRASVVHVTHYLLFTATLHPYQTSQLEK